VEPLPDLPVFPLGTVLFPGTPLPLHIFEQRYRLMLSGCLAQEGERRAFVVCLIQEGDEVVERPEGMPATRAAVPHKVGTIAQIAAAQQLPDGRSLVLCMGGERVRLRGIVDERPYLVGRVERYLDKDEGHPSPELSERAEQAYGAAQRLLAALEAVFPESAGEQRAQLRSLADALPEAPGALSHFLPRLLGSATPPERQALLEAPTIQRRLALELPLLFREHEAVQHLLEQARQAGQRRPDNQPPHPFGPIGRPSVN
jgi:Lon protease-like protein